MRLLIEQRVGAESLNLSGSDQTLAAALRLVFGTLSARATVALADGGRFGMVGVRININSSSSDATGVNMGQRERGFYQLDVFGTQPFSGNPLAVVVDAEDLTTQQMQEISTWTNLSECTFLLPPTSSEADYRVRIFSLEHEIPFAGHPTLGTARAWLEAGNQPRH